MKTTPRTTPHAATTFVASLLIASSCALSAQTTYTYSDPSIGAANPNYWTDSAKWDLPSPEYPNAAEAVVYLPRVAGDDSVRVHIELPGTPTTIGELSIVGPSGNARWTLGGSNAQSLVLDNGSNPGLLSTTSNGIVRVVATVTSQNGTTFFSNGSMFLESTSNTFSGGITVAGAGDVRFYSTGMLGNNVITLSGTGGSVRFGNTGATKHIINNDFIVETPGGKKGIYTNNTTGLQLNGSISGPGGILLGTGSSSWNDTTELFGQNSYEGETEIRTNVVFRSLDNFGDGAITFSSNARTLTFDGENTADITTNAQGQVRSVVLNAHTTFNIGANDVTFANALTGSAGFTLTGSGSLTLLGNNAFSQATLSQGTLIVGHQNALGGSNASFTITGDSKLEILGGNHVEIGSFNLQSDAEFLYTLTADFDATQLDIIGNQTGAHLINVIISTDSQLIAGEYTLLSVSGTYDPGLQFSLDPTSFDLGVLNWDQGRLTFTVIPEPENVTLLLLSLAGFIGLFRSRRNRV